jgi:sigma-B regulation protein RsbU (phosphoserine phosphatase)
MYSTSSTPLYSESPFEKGTRWFSLIFLAPLLLLLSLPVALHIAQKPDLGLNVHGLQVVALTPGGPAAEAGLQVGDRIEGANGRTVDSWAAWYAATAGRFNLEPQTILINRDGQQQVRVINPVRPGQANLTRDYSLWVVGLTFLLIGWWVFSRRHDPVARNFFSLCFIFAFFLLGVPDLPSVPYMTAKEHLQDLLLLLLPAYFLRFFLQFPATGNQQPWAGTRFRLLLVPGLALFVLTVGVFYLHPAPTGSTSQTALEAASIIYMLVFFLASLVIFSRRTLRRDRPIQRTKMMVILLGLLCGLGPFLTAVILGNVSPESVGPHVQYLAFSLLLVPASFALAIMRYGALDKAFVVRISLVYGLLTLFMLLVYLLLVVGVGHLLGRIFQIDSYPVLVLMIAVSSLFILPLRKLIQNWTDQAFYPSRRATRKVMARLAAQLTHQIELREVVKILVERLDELYQPRTLGLFLSPSPHDTDLRPRLILGTDAPPLEALPAESALAKILDRVRRPLFTEELEENLFAEDSDAVSLSVLTRLEAALLVPLVSGNRLLGFLAFGPKGSGDLYSQEDLANLHSLALQAASVLDSRQLYQESLDRKRLEMELEVARDLQRKLLPDGLLADQHFVITGRNEPCRMVGGDYFDYFLRSDGTLGLAIADVAGKGIPAALQMTSLQFAFRQLADTRDSPARVVKRLNDAVHSLVSGGGFVCFFFGVWDPTSGSMHYCNAGMEPPVLFRPGAAFRQSLRKGGPVLGVMPEYDYVEGHVQFQAGDRLFLYSDGMTDQKNSEEEFFDAPRLLDLVAAHLEDSPHRLIETLFQAVEQFGGEEKDDDKTAILLEIKKTQEKKSFRSSSC